MLESVDDKTKIIYIANPNNPTGTCIYIGKNDYKLFTEKVPDDVLVITDEAYFEYSCDADDNLHALNYRWDNVIVTRAFSKGYGLAGFRIGYAIAHSDLIEQLIKDDAFLEKSVSLVKKEREKLSLFFDDHNVEYVPLISNSVMMICETETDAFELTQNILEKGVVPKQLNAFGLPHCVRITIGTEKEMNQFKNSFKLIQHN